MPHSRLEALLRIWAEWMRHGGSIAEGYPYKSSGFSEYGLSSFQDVEETGDSWVAKVIDAAISDLPNRQYAAIHHDYSGSRYANRENGELYPIGTFVEVLESAKKKVEVDIEKRGVW